MKDTQRIVYLLIKHKANSLSSEENEELGRWKNESAKNKALFYELQDQVQEREAISELASMDTEGALEQLKLRMSASNNGREDLLESASRSFRKKAKIGVAIAASMLLFASAALVYLYQYHKVEIAPISNRLFFSQISPGGNKATLTLSDGSVIDLDDVVEGTIVSHQGIEITKTEDGQLVYKATNLSFGSSSESNTISTPIGGQFQVILPDGTKVWLNASSSLSYPVIFDAKERKVKLDGEAYFDVTTALNKTNEKIPFVVELDSQQHVEVLGTELNIQAYREEMVSKTTLIEGQVKVHAAGRSVNLKPGQQARIIPGESHIDVSEVQTVGVAAWKNGYFHFEEESIQDIMVKIARWYDVEVVYQGKMPDDGFGGIVSRFENVSELLSLLELTGKIHFKVEGRRVTVMP